MVAIHHQCDLLPDKYHAHGLFFNSGLRDSALLCSPSAFCGIAKTYGPAQNTAFKRNGDQFTSTLKRDI